MAQVTAFSMEPERIGGHVFLNEEHAKVRLGDKMEPCYWLMWKQTVLVRGE
jgi:hypothetical protein